MFIKTALFKERFFYAFFCDTAYEYGTACFQQNAFHKYFSNTQNRKISSIVFKSCFTCNTLI